jgi:hypothetical protein
MSRFGYTALSLFRLRDGISGGSGFSIFSSRCKGRLAAVLGRQPSYFVHSYENGSASTSMRDWHAIGLWSAGRSHCSKESKRGQALNPDHRSP